MTATAAIDAVGLVKTFGQLRAVDGVDLEVRQGEIFGVLGPNGAGKTTTLKMLATTLPIDAGQARVFGVDVAREPHRVRQLLGVTGQDASVDEDLTATENMWLFGRLQGLRSAAARATGKRLLEQFGLEEAADKPIAQFSGGMRRRLDLAVSLITRPPLIFLDEPTTGLDPRTRGQMWDTIRGLVADGCTVLLTTQYLDEADQLADRIAVIDGGRKVAEGTPDELKTSVGNSTLQLRLAPGADQELARQVVRRVAGAEPVMAPESGQMNVPLDTADRAADVLIGFRQAGVAIASVSVAKPTLDEVFLAITGHGTGQDDDPDAAEPAAAADIPLEVTSEYRIRRSRVARWPGSAAGRRPGRRRGPHAPARHHRRDRQPDAVHGLAGAEEDAPQPGAVLRRHAAAAAVHGDVRLHLRRRDLRQRQSYLPLLIPGIVAQTVLTTCMATGVQLREDMDKGVFDRFKSLPIARIAPLAGPMVADLVRYLIAASLTFVMGVIIGYRPGGGVLGVLGAIVLSVFTGWAIAWIFTWFGTIARNARSVQGMSMMILFPLTFLSNAFVPGHDAADRAGRLREGQPGLAPGVGHARPGQPRHDQQRGGLDAAGRPGGDRGLRAAVGAQLPAAPLAAQGPGAQPGSRSASRRASASRSGGWRSRYWARSSAIRPGAASSAAGTIRSHIIVGIVRL